MSCNCNNVKTNSNMAAGYCAICLPPNLNTTPTSINVTNSDSISDYICNCDCHTLGVKFILTRLDSHYEVISNIIDRLEKLEEKCTNITSSTANGLIHHANRLEKLENFRASQLNKALDEKIEVIKTCINLYAERIKELERFQDITNHQYQKIVKEKVPHKCPVCEGKGGHRDKDDVLWTCHVCEGKGIVWD